MEEQISRIAQTVQSNLGLPEEQQPLVLRYARRAVNRICIFCSRKDLPEPLEDVAAQMVEDMLRADQAGAGGGNEVSSITRGDTSIHYRDKASAYQNAANFVRDYEKMIIPFRRMKYPKEHSYD
ncbi:translation initiation factor 2 [Oscillospiraceae bacterium 21-37]|uniref:translation initiation factor 2 n=1 Tax=Acutalibacter sp. JLR.KK004 TaxID=3112622 RepID=UPI001369F3D1